MIEVSVQHATALRTWFLPDQQGPLVGLHVLNTANGACFVDRWPDPRAVLTVSGGNYSLLGDPQAFTPDDLRAYIVGFVDAPVAWEAALREAFPDMQIWPRVVLALAAAPRFSHPIDMNIRRLVPDDAPSIADLSAESAWISKTWGGPSGLASSGMAWGAFAADRLIAVACSFFVGERFEEIGVVTEAEFRGRGLSVACAGALCGDIRERGRQPSWTTSPDNQASLRVALKLGFQFCRDDRLYVVGIDIPPPARPSPDQ